MIADGLSRLGFSQSNPAAVARPKAFKNALLFCCEQFQHDAPEYVGGPVRTPNFAALAREATNFHTACTVTGLCSPSRAALFTGRLGHRTGLDDNCSSWHSRLSALGENQTTLIEGARRKGYFVGYYGKWHLGYDGPIRRGAHRFQYGGFDRNAEPGGSPQPKPDFNEFERYYDKSVKHEEKPGYYSTAKGTYEDTETYRIGKQAIDFVEESQKTGLPFFLTLAFNAVHPSYVVPPPYNQMYDYRTVKLPSNLNDTFQGKPDFQREVLWPYHDTGHMTEYDWRKSRAYYYGFISLLDRTFGQVTQALKDNGCWDNTLIVVVADHGDMCGAHNRFDKGPYSYDEILRVPLLVRVPGLPAGEISRHVSTIDVNRTLAEWMGLQPDVPNVDSRSLFPLIRDGDKGWDASDEAYYRYEWFCGRWYGIRAIRTPEHKYSFNPTGIDELYDLKQDPGEMQNLAYSSAHEKIKAELQERLLVHLQAVEEPLLYRKLRSHVSHGSTS